MNRRKELTDSEILRILGDCEPKAAAEPPPAYRTPPVMRRCPACERPITLQAVRCPHCQRYIPAWPNAA